MPESLASATRSLLTELGPDPKQNINIIVCRASELLKCDSAGFGYIETATGDLRFRAAHKLPARPSMIREHARRICTEIISSNEAQAICEFSTVENDATPAAPRLAGAGFKSFLGHRVTVNGLNTGALVALHTQNRKFSEQDRGLITFLSNILAIEESRYQREEALSRRISLEKMLKDLSTKAIAIEDSAAFTKHCIKMLGTRMGVGGCFLWEFDPERKTLSSTYEWLTEGQTPQKRKLKNIPIDPLPWGVSRLMKGEVLKINDVRTVPAKRERKLLERIGVRACLIIPLFSKDAFYGFIGLECHKAPKCWASEDILILQTAAEIIMLCIENRQLTNELIASQRNLEKVVGKRTLALRKVNKRLSSGIAAHKKTISNLKHQEAELNEKNRTLLDLTNALAALLNKTRDDFVEAEENFLLKFKKLIAPAETNSLANGLDAAHEKDIGNLREILKQLSSLLKAKRTFAYQCLTAMEIKVANHISDGKGNKEIADLLNLSPRTVEVHRYNIRKKIGIEKRRGNLKTYLRTLD